MNECQMRGTIGEPWFYGINKLSKLTWQRVVNPFVLPELNDHAFGL